MVWPISSGSRQSTEADKELPARDNGRVQKAMKRITINYDEANKNISVSSEGLTEGEALAIFD